MVYEIGIVGAARRHQGTGPFIARTFSNLGHTISGVIGTHSNSLTETVSTLANEYGIHTQGYLTLNELLEKKNIDLLAISSPADTHLQYLEEALSKGLHVFCEKPLWWPATHCMELNWEQYEHKIHQLVALAKQKRCVLQLNTQWPYTLYNFFELSAAQLSTPFKVEQFAMHLCPQSRGIQMLIDGVPHGLSMLYQLVGKGDLTDIIVEKSAHIDFDMITIHFNYRHDKGTTRTTLGLTNSQELPKPASYEINGLTVHRKVKLPSYQIQLQLEDTSLDIIDPLESSVRNFIASIEAEIESDEIPLLLGARHLYTLIEACS